MGARKKLLHHASDTGSSERCAMFLLSLWNGYHFKADMQERLYVDRGIFSDMLEVLRYLHEHNYQLDSLIGEAEIKPVIEGWGDVFHAGKAAL
jgi:hypothetical protein